MALWLLPIEHESGDVVAEVVYHARTQGHAENAAEDICRLFRGLYEPIGLGEIDPLSEPRELTYAQYSFVAGGQAGHRTDGRAVNVTGQES